MGQTREEMRLIHKFVLTDYFPTRPVVSVKAVELREADGGAVFLFLGEDSDCAGGVEFGPVYPLTRRRYFL